MAIEEIGKSSAFSPKCLFFQNTLKGEKEYLQKR